MATLTVWKFDTAEGAQGALNKSSICQATTDQVQDAAVVSYGGKKKTRPIMAADRSRCAVRRVLGMLFGLISSCLSSACMKQPGRCRQFADYGINDNFIKEVRAEVTEGTSALFLLTSGAAQDRAEAFKGVSRALHSNLSAEQEAQLKETSARNPEASQWPRRAPLHYGKRHALGRVKLRRMAAPQACIINTQEKPWTVRTGRPSLIGTAAQRWSSALRPPYPAQSPARPRKRAQQAAAQQVTAASHQEAANPHGGALDQIEQLKKVELKQMGIVSEQEFADPRPKYWQANELWPHSTPDPSPALPDLPKRGAAGRIKSDRQLRRGGILCQI